MSKRVAEQVSSVKQRTLTFLPKTRAHAQSYSANKAEQASR